MRLKTLFYSLAVVFLLQILSIQGDRDVKATTLVDDQTINSNMQLAPFILMQQGRKRKIKYLGVNLSGAEFGNSADLLGTTYDYPTPKDAWYFIQHGMNIFRVPIRWERLQRVIGGPLSVEIKYVDALVNYITANQKIINIDVHNFCRYNGTQIDDPDLGTPGRTTSAEFASFFGMLVTRYADNPNVQFTVMNEPNLIPTKTWLNIANPAIAAARKAGFKGPLYIDGNRWSGCFSWTRKDDLGDPNSVAMLDIVDPADNLIFDCHNYFNFDNSGGDPTCMNKTIGVDRAQAITSWLRTNKQRGLMGEFGAAMSTTCLSSVKYLLDFLEKNSDVWMGGCWWSAGPKWGNYYASLQPLQYDSAPRNQLVLLKYYSQGEYVGVL